MVMGRPRKPDALKERIGTARPDRKRAPIAVADGPSLVIPKVPAGLRKHGKDAWQRYWSLGEAWLRPASDLEILTRLCQAYDEREDLRKLVRTWGHIVAVEIDEQDLDEVKPNGRNRVKRLFGIKANPAVQQLRKLEELITRYEGLCGFTPSDRSRLGLAEVKRQSKLEEFLARRREGGGETP